MWKLPSLCHDLGNDIQAIPGFAEAFIVEAGQRNVIRHENNAHGACQPQVRMQFVGRSYFRLDHLEGGDSGDLSSAALSRRGLSIEESKYCDCSANSAPY